MTDEERRLYENAIKAKDTAIRALVEENQRLKAALDALRAPEVRRVRRVK